MSSFPEPPFYVVNFFTEIRKEHLEEYMSWAARMRELAEQQAGFLGMHSIRQPDGKGVTVSYWRTREDIQNWKMHPEHVEAQQLGMKKFYSSIELLTSFVEKI